MFTSCIIPGVSFKKEMTALTNMMVDLPANPLRDTLGKYKARIEEVLLEWLD